MVKNVIKIPDAPLYLLTHDVVTALKNTLRDELGRRYDICGVSVQQDEKTGMERLVYYDSYYNKQENVCDNVCDTDGNEVVAEKGDHPLIQLYKSIQYLEKYAYYSDKQRSNNI